MCYGVFGKLDRLKIKPNNHTYDMKQIHEGITLHMTGYSPAYTKSVEKGSFLTYKVVDVCLQKGYIFHC